MKPNFARLKYTCVLLAIHLLATASPLPVVLPCEGCNLVFGALQRELTSHARIAPAEEVGEPLHFQGRVVDVNGKPVSGIIVYAYHANRDGAYPQNPQSRTLHGTLHAWAMTDARGQYSFDTIRPGISADDSVPSHIHMIVMEPKGCVYTIEGILFADDPRSSTVQRDAKLARGGEGKMMPVKDGSGIWQVTRDIELGRNIPGYEKCRPSSTATSTKM